MKVRLSNEQLRDYLGADVPQFAKYVSPLLDLANQYAQGTRPKIVGQMSDLIQQFTGQTIDEWAQWYQSEHPGAIQDVADRIEKTVLKLREAMESIDRPTIEAWVKDLVIVKTFVGLRFQEAILIEGARLTNATYRLAEPTDEARGIDG